MYEIMVKVDMRDADYSVAINDITEEELDRFRPLIKAISEFKPYEDDSGSIHYSNCPYGECCRDWQGDKTIEEIYPDFDEDLIQEFIEEYCYWTSECGFRSIYQIEVYPKPEKEVLLGRR